MQRGQPVAGAAVSLLALGGGVPLAVVSDDDGAFLFSDLAEGRFRVWAAAGDRAARAVAVDRVGGGPFRDVVLELEPGALVGGRVVDSSSGRGVAAHVTLIADDADEPPRAATSGADGAFRVEGVPLGRWTADAFAPGYVSADAVRFQAGTGYVPSVQLRRGGVLAGRVVDGSGAPVVGAVVVGRAEAGGADVSQEMVARRLGGETAGWGAGLAPAGTAGLVTATGLRFLPRGELGVLVGPLPFPPPPGAVGGAVRIASPLGGAAPQPRALPADPALEPRFITDGEGHYRLTGLAPGRYRVLATHRDFADGASEPRDVDLGTELADVDLVLHGGLVVHGLVTDEEGQAIAGAVVTARGDRGVDRRHSLTDTDGSYRIGPLSADVDLEVSAPGSASALRRIQVEVAARATATREEDFVLGRADAELRGRVTDAGGFPVAGASVRAVSGSAARAVTDAGGRFRLAGVRAGRHRLLVEHRGYPAAEFEAATGVDAELRLEVGGAMDIEVRERAGAPVAGARLVARGPDGELRRATSDRHGAARLAPLAPGTWTVQASARGYADSDVEAEISSGSRPGQIPATAVRIELGAGAILAGVVRDQDGERVAGAAVAVGGSRTVTDADGRFRLTQVRTGPVVLEAEKGDSRGILELDLAPGDELVTLDLRVQ